MWGVHSCEAWVLVISICVTLITSEKAAKPPEWKDGADALMDKYMKQKTEGEDLKLSCPVKGRPKPVMEWWKDNEVFFPRTDRIRVKGTNIKFSSVAPEDRGNYSCVARNKAGELSFTFVVDVIEKIWPLEANVSSNQSVYEGEDARFFCIVTNDPTARIQWMRIENNPEDIGARPSHQELDPTDQSPEILILHDVRKEDEGQYTCLLGNQFGSKYHHMYLIVMEKTTTTTSTTSTSTTTTSTTTSTTSTTTTTTTPSTTSTTMTTTTTTQPPPTTMKPKKKKKDKKKKKKDRKKDKKKDRKKNKDRDRQPKNDYYENNDEIITMNPGYYPDFNSNLYNINNGFPDDDNGYNTNTDIYQPNRGYGHDDSDMGYGYDHDRSYGQDSGMDPDAADNDFTMGSSEGSHGAKNDTAATSATKNSISVWTVYIIVGSVAGGILLAGLVAIAIALCCQKEEDSQYKSTSV